MSTNLLKNNDVWDDTELIKMYDESCKRITKEIISQTKLEIVNEDDSPVDDETDELCDKDDREIDSDKEDGEMDEDEEEGEIRDKSGPGSKKRSIDDTVPAEENDLEKHEDGQMVSDEEGEMTTKKFKSDSNSPSPDDTNFGDTEIRQEASVDPRTTLQHPSVLSETLINEHHSSICETVINNKNQMKANINAALGSYWQAGYHIKNLEDLLKLDSGSLQIPLPKINETSNNGNALNSKLNAALISYWQMGYYDASCELAFSHKE